MNMMMAAEDEKAYLWQGIPYYAPKSTVSDWSEFTSDVLVQTLEALGDDPEARSPLSLVSQFDREMQV